MPCANATLTGLSLKLEKDPSLILQVSLIRGMLVLSLCLQLGLVMSGYFRKMTNRFIVSLPSVSYVFYLAAEPATTTALTMILRSKEVRDDMPALLWTPLLLWYLGGPYNLTAYAVQDSETWTRHLVFFLIRLGYTIYTCYLLGMGAKTNSLALILIVVFMLLAGTIKYAEKIWALWSSTPPQMVSRIYFGRQEVVEWRDKQKLSDFLKKPRGEELRFLCLAYSSFMASMLSFLGLAHHHHHHHSAIRDDTLTLLHDSEPARAFRWLGIQLELLHDTLYTKFSMPTIKHWRLSTNLIYILTLIASLLVFSTVIEHHTHYVPTDIILTYLLLCGTILLEFVSIIMQIFSTWTMVSLDEWFITHLWPLKLRLKRLVKPKKHFHIGQHDLVQQCFKERPTLSLMALALKFRNVSFVSTILTVKSTISRFFQSELVLIDEELEKYIYSHVTDSTKQESLNCLIRKQQDAVASSVLQRHDELHDFTKLDGMSFIDLIFHFHIMTNVLYHREKPSDGGKMAKRLSDYMMYLALVRPLMLPEGLQGDVIYKTMIKEVNEHYFQKRGDVIGDFAGQLYDGNSADEHSPGAEEEGNTFQYYKPLPLKTGGWLSKKLQSQLQPNSATSSALEEQAWDNISRIWVDLLAYAAVCCGWKVHVTQLKDGGELLTYVALLMHHLGLHRKSPPL